MPRTKRRLALVAGALLVGALGMTPQAASQPAANAVTDYTLTVDPTATGPAISDTMNGIFLEDINHAADGGLTPSSCRTARSSTAPPTTTPTRR